MNIKPKAGIIVRHPHNRRILKAEGEVVSENINYWNRRINDGDVIKIVEENNNKNPNKDKS